MKASLAKKLAMHKPGGRKIGIQAAKNEEGVPIHDEDEAAAFLSRYWGKQFEEKPIDEALARDFVQRFAVQFPAFVMSFCFRDTLNKF